MDRVQEFELWEKNKRHEMQYIRTSVANQPQIFYMPKEHNDMTLTKFESSMAAIEEEIKNAKAIFEDELLKIEARASLPENRGSDDDLLEEDDDEERQESKPKSVVVKQPHKRPRQHELEERIGRAHV